MDKIKVVDFYIKKYNNLKFEKEDRLSFLNEFKFHFYHLSKLSTSKIFKIYYTCFSRLSMPLIHTRIDFISEYLDRIKPENFLDLNEVYNFFYNCLMSNKIKDCYIKQDDYENMLKQFNSMGFEKELELFLKETFRKKDNTIDFNAYNGFLNLCNEPNKLTFISSISNLIELGDFELREDELKNAEKIIKKEYPGLIANIDMMKKTKDNLISEEIKFNKNKAKILTILENIKKNIQNNNKIDINKASKGIADEYLLAVLIDYNNNFIVSEYDEVLKEREQLQNNSITQKEILLKKYDFNIDISKIEVDDDTLETKLKTINEYLIDIKKYNNIVLTIINKLDTDKFKILINYIIQEFIDSIFVLDNIKRLTNYKELDNFIKNIKILKDLGLNIKNIIKFDKEILFMDNNYLLNIIEKYKEYNIEFSEEIYNFDFLRDDYSFIIDKFIEINEYNLIKHNPTLITPTSNIILKRCIFYKEIEEAIVNEQGKLIGNLRKENNFPINNKDLEESILENFIELIPSNVLNILNKPSYKKTTIDLELIEKYRIDDYCYNINGMIISINKIIKCMSSLIDSKLKDLYPINELLYYSIIYNYPKLITRDNIIMLKKILEIKTKTLELN